MALRVLLADESSTIKKVFQLALQDFAVEVRPVNIGVDVLTVAQTFKPDIIFADVLLQKRNGYDVASDLKQHATLKQIPVVIMWSGFMELDEDKFEASQADAQLEKPFDVETLRKLVTHLVPKTQTQNISQYLSFPKMPEIEEQASQDLPSVVDAPDEFQQVTIPQIKKSGSERFKIDLKPEELEPDHIPVSYHVPGDELPVDSVPDDELIMESNETPELPPIPNSSVPSTLDEAQLEKIIRAQSAEIIESVVWKIVPELATQIIERELSRLLKERDTHP